VAPVDHRAVAGNDLEQRLARWEALSLARLLGRDAPTAGDPIAFTASRVRIAAVVLARWSTDAEIRDALRAVFAAAVPDQRALIALGDIDTWRRDGRQARHWWVQAAAGPDPDLAAIGAWRAARADIRGGRVEDALPLLHQADLAGITEASVAAGRILSERGNHDDADAATRRSRTGERLLLLAEERLLADDVDGAERELSGFEPMPPSPEWGNQEAWAFYIQGEIAFRRGDLEEAWSSFSRALYAPGWRTRRTELRLAQIAVADADAEMAFQWTERAADGDDAEADQARLLVELHAALIEEGRRRIEEREGEDWE
jgi:tetratricopeptide (TPR) repeat protein